MGTGEYGNAMDFRMKFRLPAGVSGDRCLIQWRYITGNSCEMPGYDQVAWPSQAWRNAGVGTCALPLSADGSGAPERFWNCADVKVLPAGSGPAPGPNPAPADPAPADPAPADPAPGGSLPPVGAWAACGGESTAGCGKDEACFSCTSSGGRSYMCDRQSQWYWQCIPGTSSTPAPVPAVPAPAPSPAGSKAPWAACGGLSTAGCQRDDDCFSCRSNGRQSFGCTRQSEWYWQCAPGAGSATGRQTAMSKSGGEASAGVVRVDKKGRTCSDLGKKACKKKRWCKFNRAAQTCEGGSSDPAAAASTGATAVKVDRKGRTCAEYGRRKCNRKSWCTYDYGSGTCQDVSADPNLAEAAVSDVRVDRRGRSCADYGKGLCQKRKWCRFDSAKGACEDKNESYLRDSARSGSGAALTAPRGPAKTKTRA